MNVNNQHYRTVWMKGQSVFMIHQPYLPHRFTITELKNHRETAKSISTMIVRGAGAIGATGAFGMAQAALEAPESSFESYLSQAADLMRNTRPTAQNLFYGIQKVMSAIDRAGNITDAKKAAVLAAQAVADEDALACEQIGQYGSPLIKPGANISTHCNAGWLAFVDWGSALAPVYTAARQGKDPFVYVDETRPRGQGARLTAWELREEKIRHAVIADNATGFYLSKGKIDMVIVGADRIAMNGDVANKIGTYTSALAAHASGVPFYVAAPCATIDPNCPAGADIPIEERSADEVVFTWGWSDDDRFTRVRTVPVGSDALNPAFDVTPAELITGIITEKGVFTPSEISDAAPKI
ncbi:MAG: S-methyl-5-thioribose-1-phosphate isomerase [Proteobacteria bacterium]|nr:S-methyl-5-thioribose-1-phosphate isomerase [Pseudomonadota bacterium]